MLCTGTTAPGMEQQLSERSPHVSSSCGDCALARSPCTTPGTGREWCGRRRWPAAAPRCCAPGWRRCCPRTRRARREAHTRPRGPPGLCTPRLDSMRTQMSGTSDSRRILVHSIRTKSQIMPCLGGRLHAEGLRVRTGVGRCYMSHADREGVLRQWRQRRAGGRILDCSGCRRLGGPLPPLRRLHCAKCTICLLRCR